MDAEGYVHLPQEPGMGYRILWDYIEDNLDLICAQCIPYAYALHNSHGLDQNSTPSFTFPSGAVAILG